MPDTDDERNGAADHVNEEEAVDKGGPATVTVPPGAVVAEDPVNCDVEIPAALKTLSISEFESSTCEVGSYKYDGKFMTNKKVDVEKIASNIDDFVSVQRLSKFATAEECRDHLPPVCADVFCLDMLFDALPEHDLSPYHFSHLKNQLESRVSKCEHGVDCDILKGWFRDPDTPGVLKELFFDLHTDVACTFDEGWLPHIDVALKSGAVGRSTESNTSLVASAVTFKVPTRSAKLFVNGIDLHVSLPEPLCTACVNVDETSTITGLNNSVRRLILIPSFRRSKRGRVCLKNHDGFDWEKDLVIVVCRTLDFDAYTAVCTGICAVIALPPLCFGIGYARHMCVNIAMQLGREQLILLDDDVKTFRRQDDENIISLIDACMKLETVLTCAKDVVAMVGATKSQLKVKSNNYLFKTPQVLVLLNVTLLKKSKINYSYQLPFMEDFVLGWRLQSSGFLVVTCTLLRARSNTSHDHGGTGSPGFEQSAPTNLQKRDNYLEQHHSHSNKCTQDSRRHKIMGGQERREESNAKSPTKVWTVAAEVEKTTKRSSEGGKKVESVKFSSSIAHYKVHTLRSAS